MTNFGASRSTLRCRLDRLIALTATIALGFGLGGVATVTRSGIASATGPVVTTYGDQNTVGAQDITVGPDGAPWLTPLSSRITHISRDSSGNPTGSASTLGIGIAGHGIGSHITTNPQNGRMFFTDGGDSSIQEITPSGQLTPPLTSVQAVSQPSGIACHGLFCVWTNLESSSAHPGNGSIGFIIPALTGNALSVAYDSTIDLPYEITAASDGTFWFTNRGNNSIGRFSSNTITNFANSSVDTPFGITEGPDGAIWFANSGNDSIGRLDRATGAITSYTNPNIHTPLNIASGPDGAIWFTNGASHSIGRITTGGAVTSYDTTTGSPAFDIAAGSDNSLWFTDANDGLVGRITVPTNYVQKTVDAGATVRTSGTAGVHDPVTVSVKTPVAGTVTISAGPTTMSPPTGFTFSDQQVNISAPPATTDHPHQLVFTFDPAWLAAHHLNIQALEVFHSGAHVFTCTNPMSAVAFPSPSCVASRGESFGVPAITVYTASASPWNFGTEVVSPPPTSCTTLSVATESLPGASLARPYSARLAACGSSLDLRWKRIGKLPKGLKLNPRTGVISGTPKKLVGTFSFQAQVREVVKAKLRHTATRAYTIVVS